MAASTRPNLIYTLTDDLGYGDVSCLNPESKLNTVNLDRMASEGMIFTDAHASSAVCTPSRYSILTGRYCWRSTLKEGVGWGFSPHLIEDGRSTVASMLQAQGYHTACIGKWHLGMDWPTADGTSTTEEAKVDFSKPIQNGPTAFGFDEFFGISASLDMPPYVYIQNNLATAVPDHTTVGDGPNTDDGPKAFWRKGPTAPDFVHEEVTPMCQQKAVEFIHARAAANAAAGDPATTAQPFFLYLPLPSPHTPILPTPDFRGKSGTNEYGDFVLQCDAVVGSVLAALDETGQADNTILLFTSDNGCSPMANFEELSAVGHRPSYHFRGHKADIYDGGHRIPLIVRWPDGIKAGSRTDQLVCLSDLFATMAEITGHQVADNEAEDSVSNLSIWSGNRLNGVADPVREAAVHHSINGSFAIRRGAWKLEMCPGSGGWSSPRPGEEPEGTPPIQLYDMHADVGERVNLQDEYPEVVKELTTLLTRYVTEGRSTPGAPQPNTGDSRWPQISWIPD